MKKGNATPTDVVREISQRLEIMFERYARTGRAQNVSFRRIVHWLKVGERGTHYIHSYPAKLLPHIAHFFLNANGLSRPGDKVLDPFGGTGTVALESIIAGRTPLYCDVNPLAKLIAKVKTQPLDVDNLNADFVQVKATRANHLRKKQPQPRVVNIDHWYTRRVRKELSALKSALCDLATGASKEFLLVAFSQTCRKMSNADPRLTVPVKCKVIPKRSNYAVWQSFDEQVRSNLKRYTHLRSMLGESRLRRAEFVGTDARKLFQPDTDFSAGTNRLRKNAVQLIVTSPPYAGAQKYVRATCLSLGWLDLVEVSNLKALDRNCIGREHFLKAQCQLCPSVGIQTADRLIKKIFSVNPLRSLIVATYLREMDLAIKEMVRVLKPGGYLIIVVGNNRVCGFDFKTSEFKRKIAERYGMITRLQLIDEIRSRGLMTKRNKTASVIAREWVLVFQKPLHHP